MNKAFVKDNAGDSDDLLDEQEEAAEAGQSSVGPLKNYITQPGLQKLKDELLNLIDIERPETVKVVSWAASNGDRSENGDYLYGKKRLREIDRRIRFLTKRIDAAVVVDPSQNYGNTKVFFGATVSLLRGDGSEQTLTITGIDEADASKQKISWIAPLSKALIKQAEGDAITFHGPQGPETIEILSVSYPQVG